MRNVCLRKALVVGIIVLFLLIAIYPSSAIDTIEESNNLLYNGNTLYVGGDGPGNYTKIQDAIDNASDGDTVFVYNGIYYERVKLRKTISLLGENRINTIIDAGGKDCPIDLEANNIHVSGFTLQNSGNDDYNDAGIHFKNWGSAPESHNNVISGNRMINNWDGIFGINSENNYMSDNIIMNNRNFGIFFQAGCHTNKIENNQIFSNKMVGICIQATSNVKVIRNTINDNGLIGIYIFSGSFYNRVHGNNIMNNSHGVALDSSNNDISSNLISNSNEYGIFIFYGSQNMIRKNNFIDNRIHCSFEYELGFKVLGIFFLRPFQLNKFFRNYWDNHPTANPKAIKGKMWCYTFLYMLGLVDEIKILDWYNFDWIPARKPYDIGL